jgi:myo-inositol catabolism protein IolH
MVKIALDPAVYHASMSVADEVRKAADLGYEYLELSPRADWFFWHHYPKADDDAIADARKTLKETGVGMLSLVPVATICVFGWEERRRHPPTHARQSQSRTRHPQRLIPRSGRA